MTARQIGQMGACYVQPFCTEPLKNLYNVHQTEEKTEQPVTGNLAGCQRKKLKGNNSGENAGGTVWKITSAQVPVKRSATQ